MTQTELARRIKSSQSRVAKMEAADGSVSLDLLIRSLLALGATRKDLATAIAGKQTSPDLPRRSSPVPYPKSPHLFDVVKDKPLVWLHGEVKTPPWSLAARREAGYLLRRLQLGDRLSLPASRPMPSIGTAVHELRIKEQSAE